MILLEVAFFTILIFQAEFRQFFTFTHDGDQTAASKWKQR